MDSIIWLKVYRNFKKISAIFDKAVYETPLKISNFVFHFNYKARPKSRTA